MGFNDSGQISLSRLSQPAYAQQQRRSRVVPALGEGTRGVWGAAGHQRASLPLSCSNGAQKWPLRGMQRSITLPRQHLMGLIMAAEASPAELPRFPAGIDLSANDDFFFGCGKTVAPCLCIPQSLFSAAVTQNRCYQMFLASVLRQQPHPVSAAGAAQEVRKTCHKRGLQQALDPKSAWFVPLCHGRFSSPRY